jgi:hypothetical protein
VPDGEVPNGEGRLAAGAETLIRQDLAAAAVKYYFFLKKAQKVARMGPSHRHGVTLLSHR